MMRIQLIYLSVDDEPDVMRAVARLGYEADAGSGGRPSACPHPLLQIITDSM
jgi:hypothetical protein